jgi:fused signal recognition particle receptor
LSGFGGLRALMARTRTNFAERMSGLVGRTELTAATWDDLEEALITADLGAATTDEIVGELRQRQRDGILRDASELRMHLRLVLLGLLRGETAELLPEGPVLVLVVGFNGAGKTTSVAKLGNYWNQRGRKVLLVAGDTFRAAGSEQLGVWADRLRLPKIEGQRGGDAAALAFDAVGAARARGLDLVLMDTAGRIHTKTNLMDELGKLRRVAERQSLPCRTLLVLDASTGQNGLAQAAAFRAAVGLDGIVATKLDGTARGGVLFSIARELGAPVRFIGTGEGADDLAPFDPEAFVDAVIGED